MRLEFQRAAHHHAGQLPAADEEYLDWLALMQHYGGPTRLLDFTHSFYTAAFFAMEDWPHKGMPDAAVWAVNRTVLFERAKRKFEISDMRLDSPEWLKLVNDVVARSIEAKSDPFVLAVEPHRLDVRLTAQRGTFLFPCDIGTTFQHNLEVTLNLRRGYIFDAPNLVGEWSDTMAKECHDGKVAILKILLPCKEPRNNFGEAYQIMSDLRMMNITAATLFPGLDGFARSMSYHLRHANERPPA